MEKIKVEDIIKKLQELQNQNYNVYLEVTPNVERLENCDGTGWETVKYTYTIILEGEEIRRRYKNNNGIIEYIKEEDDE